MRSVNLKTEKENHATGRAVVQPIVTVRVSPHAATRGQRKSRRDALSLRSLETPQLLTCESPRLHSAGQDIINQYKQAVANCNGRALARMIQSSHRPARVTHRPVRRRDYTAYRKSCVGSTAFVDTIYLTENTPTKPATPTAYKRPHRFTLGRRSALDFVSIT